ELSSSTFSTLHPSSDATQELSSSTLTSVQPSSHAAVKLTSSTFSSLQQSSDAAVKLSSSTFSSLQPSSDATLELSSGTITSLQPSSLAAVKLSSSTFSSLLQTADATLELSSGTFSSLLLSSDAQVKSNPSTISSLQPSSHAAVKLSSSTFSSLLQTADTTVKLSYSTFSTLQPSSDAAVKLSSSTFSTFLSSSDSTVKLSSSTFSSLLQTADATLELSSTTFSTLQPSSDATLELSSGTFTSLQPSSHAAVKLSSSSFSFLLQTADATVKLSSSTFSSLPLTADATLKLTSETFSSLPSSSDLDVNLFTTLSGSLDPEVKLIALISSSLLQLSEVELTSSKSPALFKEDFISNTYSSSFEYELSAHPESSIFDTPSSYDNRVISSESSMPTTEKPCTEVILTGSHLPKKLSSSLSGTYLSDSLSYTSSGLRENASHISSSSTIPLVSSMPVTEMHFISSYSVSLFPTTISKQLQKPRTERITSRSLDISETINGTGFKSDLESKIFRVSSFITNPNEMPSSLHLFGTVQNQTEDLFNSETPTSIRSSSLSTRLKPSLSKLDTETVEVSSTYNFETFSLSTTPNQYFTKEPSSTVSEETDDPQITTDTLVSMTRKDERTFKSDLSYTSLVLLSSKVSETSSSIYTSSSLTSEITSALSQGMNSLTSTPSLIVHTEDLHLPDSRVQIGISPSKTVEIDIEDQMSKQSIIPSSRTLSSHRFQETTPLPSLRYQLSVSVTSELTLTSSSVGNEDSFSSTKSKDVLQVSLSTRDQLLATTSTASSSILPLTVIETSTSILPRNIDKDLLLTVGIIVKTSVNIDSHAVNIQIKEGLKRCFIEGGLKADKDSYRKKRANADANVTVEIFGMERKESEPSHVDVDFYVLVDGIIQSPAEIVVIFSRLTIAETSAYMTFPVISSVKLLSRNVLQTPTDVAADSNISLVTIFLIGAPTICAFIATVLLISVYCRKGDNSFRKNWSSLHDADLKVDIEKGEVVSASVSRNKNIPDFSFDNGKDFGSDWTHIKPFLHSRKEFQKKEQSFKRSLSDMFSTSKRLDRLRNLGFHVSEVRKPDQPQSKEIREVTPNATHELKISREEYLVDAIDALNVINDLDKATDSSRVTCSVEPLREVIEQRGYNDLTNESDRRTRSVAFQPKVRNSSSSTAEFYPNIRPPSNDSLVDISTAIERLSLSIK
ncbi:uncharacterized protein LOC132759063, partial [Ruditapes philippinarum]|uniref:uncharacterized protein LOC132759063 n=1 Tax=Ruditapes philippinarum TaxID=129788 RepID=UPI00295B6D30